MQNWHRCACGLFSGIVSPSAELFKFAFHPLPAAAARYYHLIMDAFGCVTHGSFTSFKVSIRKLFRVFLEPHWVFHCRHRCSWWPSGKLTIPAATVAVATVVGSTLWRHSRLIFRWNIMKLFHFIDYVLNYPSGEFHKFWNIFNILFRFLKLGRRLRVDSAVNFVTLFWIELLTDIHINHGNYRIDISNFLLEIL